MKATTIQEYMDHYTSIFSFTGVISVIKHGKTLFQNAYGEANLEFNIPNSLETKFTLASVSKQFTAFAILQLFDKGLIDLDLPVNNYLPETVKVDNRITIHHLLSHTSGLKNFYTFEDDYFQILDRSNYNRDKFFNRYFKQALAFEPGSKFEYNNAGYNLLAWLIEKVSEMSFQEYLTEHVFKQIGMIDTYLDNDQDIIKNKAYSYTRNGNEIIRCPYYNEKYSIGAGAIVSNCKDLKKWYECLKEKKILSPKAYERYFSTNLNNYCYGLNKDVKHDKTRFYHGGDHLGSLALVQYFFDEDICIIILANSDTSNQYRMGNAISDIIFKGETELVEVEEEIQLDENLAKVYEGVYLEEKIELRRTDNEWKFVRYDDNLHISIYPIGNHKFAAKWFDRLTPYTLSEEDGNFKLFGFSKVKK